MNNDNPNLSYLDTGVNIDAEGALIEKFKLAVVSTKRPGELNNIGGFGALFDLKASGYNDPILVSTTDGVGIKLKLSVEMDRYDTIGQD